MTDGKEGREGTTHTKQVQSLWTGPALHGTCPRAGGVEGESYQTPGTQWGRNVRCLIRGLITITGRDHLGTGSKHFFFN